MSIKIEMKTVLPYVVLIATVGMTWGMWSERLNAVEKKADSVAEMQQEKCDVELQQNIVMTICCKYATNIFLLQHNKFGILGVYVVLQICKT